MRPEQIVVSGEPGDDRGTARVLGAEFYGHDAVVTLRAEWDESEILVARTSDAGTLPKVGARVALSVRGRVVAWSDSAPPGGAEAADGAKSEQ